MTRRDEQREATRLRIAHVAAAVLVEGGSAPTTIAVQRAAGISRGALLHHYPTREQLLTAAVATLRAGNAASVQHALATAVGADQVERAVRALAASALRPEMSAEYGLWAASRTDPDLREALRLEERGARDALHEVIDAAFGPGITDHPAYQRIAALTIQFLRGLAITQTLSDTDARTDALIRDWGDVVRLILADPAGPPGRPPTTPGRRPGTMAVVRVVRLDHVQLAMPAGREADAVAFYEGVLGIPHVPKPDHLSARGGCWFEDGDLKVHLGVDASFRAATKAHPAFIVDDVRGIAAAVVAAGFPVDDDEPLDGFDRVYVSDPFGNRIELMQPRASPTVEHGRR